MTNDRFTIEGHIVDVTNRRIYPGEVTISNGRISNINANNGEGYSQYILPGFVDAHVHIESSMLVPSEFARLAVIHGTVATVSDPHEIANVMGEDGVHYMIENGKQVPFHFNFGAPSCVPATTFETAGAELDTNAIDRLLHRHEIRYLSEMMNYPGIINRDEQVLKKIEVAKRMGKPIDGHAPGLTGEQAIQYINAGISTDHECFTYDEALFKLRHGMKVIIREGSAAKNFEALIPLLDMYPDVIMFCSDDKHPNDLVRGHINELVRRSLGKGIEFWKVLRAATLNPVLHYQLENGLLREQDSADFIVVDDLELMNIKKTFINGQLVAENGQSFIGKISAPVINNFHCNKKSPDDFRIAVREDPTGKSAMLKVIEAFDGQLITKTHFQPLSTLVKKNKDVEYKLESDIESDVLKFAVVNRYTDTKPSIAFIKNFGLKEGAIASCVGHDSHNILCVGASNEMICEAVNMIIESKGGLAAVSKKEKIILPLPVAGIMSNGDAYEIAEQYEKLDALAKRMGSKLSAPFMTLSFMALLVIPQLKLSDKGLFDGEKFQFTDLIIK